MRAPNQTCERRKNDERRQIPKKWMVGDRLVKLDYDVMMAGVNTQLTTFTPMTFSF